MSLKSLSDYASLGTLGIATFLLFLYPSTDSDLGWHLRYGNDYLAKKSITLPNTYSSQMENYIYVNHSWASDIIAATTFNFTGFLGLSVLGACLITASFLLTHYRYATTALPSLLIFYFFNQELLNHGFRPQLFSLVFFACIFMLLRDYPRHRLVWYLMPFIFLIWANLHGQFILGLITLVVYAYFNRQTKHISPKLINFSTLVSILVTFINPFFYQLHLTSITHIAAPVTTYVIEWQSWPITSPKFIALLIWFVLITTYFIKPKNITKSPLSLITFSSGILALKVRRLIPPFLIISTPPLARKIAETHNLLLIKIMRFHMLGLLLVISFGLKSVAPRQILNQNWQVYCQSGILCSEAALTFMKANGVRGKIFNSDRLGGWLIYRYPDTPVYMDGRMTHWRQNGSYLADTYQKLVHGEPGSIELLLASDFDYVLIQPQFGITSAVNMLNWPLIYQDDTLLLYQNPFR